MKIYIVTGLGSYDSEIRIYDKIDVLHMLIDSGDDDYQTLCERYKNHKYLELIKKYENDEYFSIEDNDVCDYFSDKLYSIIEIEKIPSNNCYFAILCQYDVHQVFQINNENNFNTPKLFINEVSKYYDMEDHIFVVVNIIDGIVGPYNCEFII